SLYASREKKRDLKIPLRLNRGRLTDSLVVELIPCLYLKNSTVVLFEVSRLRVANFSVSTLARVKIFFSPDCHTIKKDLPSRQSNKFMISP
ncbi:MAG: hypothetical protein ACKPFF_15865, partial [Planktothrix sp.]